MGRLFKIATSKKALTNAWHRIRENGLSSSSSETRAEISWFEQDAVTHINRLQRRLRDHVFEFDPQKGVLKGKGKGKKKRGIVMASVQNRIVERALLERLQTDCSFVREVIQNPFSVGGVPHRSVPHGLAIIEQSMTKGKTQFIRSDISGFFDNVPRDRVLAQLRQHVDDDEFMTNLAKATEVTLSNEHVLGDDRKLFPTDDHGIAQGSPLSPLFGNILLHKFDQKLNERGIVCIRFIDDFVLMADSTTKVRKAYQSAVTMLTNLELRCHDPFETNADLDKSEHGDVRSGFIFLGYKIEPGLYQPSRKARKKILGALDGHFRAGRNAIEDCLKFEDSFASRQRYVQTLDLVDRVLRGWGNSFAYSNSRMTMEDLDRKIDEKLDVFRKWYRRKHRDMDWKARRRSGGICLLSDIKQKKLEDVPFVVKGSGKRFRSSNRTLRISTDGAVLSGGKRLGKDQGPGGWGFVFHETDERFSGSVERTTNNRMELQAVIEAIKAAPDGKSLHIHTDSRYVEQGINCTNPVNSNSDLWKDYQSLTANRAIKISWVKGHSDNKYNDIADRLAHNAAKNLAKRLNK